MVTTFKAAVPALSNVATYEESSSVTESPLTMPVKLYAPVERLATVVVLYARVGTVMPLTVTLCCVTVAVNPVGCVSE